MRAQILLSTFNGLPYLEQQLQSLMEQDHRPLEVLARDDGSHDGTLSLLQDWTRRWSALQIVSGENMGAARSFLTLLESASSEVDYLAFCDQDDVWLSDKISRAVAVLDREDPTIPTLYCSRAAMVDADLRFLRYSDLPIRGLSFGNALVECPVIGCTSVINQAARQLLLLERPRTVMMHDWWIYLVVSACGRVIFDREPRLLHRRHPRVNSPIPVSFVDRARSQLRRQRQFRRRTPSQAEELQRIYGQRLPEDSRIILERFLAAQPRLSTRIAYAMHGEAHHQSRLGNMLFKTLLVFNRVHY